MGGINNVSVEVLRNLRQGERVTLPDGEEAIVSWSGRGEVHVVQPWRLLGRGPWIFHRWQVEPVGAGS